MERIWLCFLILIMILLQANIAMACVGSRPLSMGGAFIGVADSIETVYWNPSGLAQIDTEDIHVTLTLNERDQMGYRSFVAFNKNFGNISTGLSYITRLRSWNVLEEWYVLSLATKLHPNFAIGINGRYEMHSDGFTDRQLDLSSLWSVTDRFKLGFLYQSLNNFRPGVSYRLGENIILSADVYNALNHKDILGGEHRIMWGAEFKQNDLKLRLGQYAGDYTYGLSYKGIDFAVMKRKDNIILLGFNL